MARRLASPSAPRGSGRWTSARRWSPPRPRFCRAAGVCYVEVAEVWVCGGRAGGGAGGHDARGRASLGLPARARLLHLAQGRRAPRPTPPPLETLLRGRAAVAPSAWLKEMRPRAPRVSSPSRPRCRAPTRASATRRTASRLAPNPVPGLHDRLHDRPRDHPRDHPRDRPVSSSRVVGRARWTRGSTTAWRVGSPPQPGTPSSAWVDAPPP